MRKHRDSDLLIEDILENAEAIFEFTTNCNYEDFINDKMKLYAVIRAFEVIGEATKYVSEEIKANHPLIDWRDMGDFRNQLIHNYFGIDYEKVWDIIKNDLPYNFELLKQING